MQVLGKPNIMFAVEGSDVVVGVLCRLRRGCVEWRFGASSCPIYRPEASCCQEALSPLAASSHLHSLAPQRTPALA